MRAPENFRALASLLRPAHAPEIAESGEEQEPSEERDDPGEAFVATHADAEIIREIRLFHARVQEGVEDAVDALLTDIAAHVVARDLQIAPADLKKIVDRALERFFGEEPMRIRVSPNEAAALEIGVPVVADDSLREGDAILELRTGCVEATLGVRLAAVLRGLP